MSTKDDLHDGAPDGDALARFEARLQYRFADRALLSRALVHPSWRHEYGNGAEDNQRLEFLGDAVLALAVSDLLFTRLPEAAEGQLTRVRARLVCEERLADLARSLGLGAVLALGRGEEASGGADKDSILADACEAVIGAIYRDGGLAAAAEFVARELAAAVDEPLVSTGRDPKSALQEQTQRELNVTPRYRLAATHGPPHAPRFVAKVDIPGHMTCAGEGPSKKDAERAAAAVALAALAPAPGASAPLEEEDRES